MIIKAAERPFSTLIGRNQLNANRVSTVIKTALISIKGMTLALRIFSFGLTGFSCNTLPWPFSVARDKSPTPSVTRLSHNSWVAVSGRGRPMAIAVSRVINSAKLVVTRKKLVSRALVKTIRPSSMAWTMVAKLSSARITLAEPLATSVPMIPIAIPTSACLSAGASFTPSPVMAMSSPSD